MLYETLSIGIKSLVLNPSYILDFETLNTGKHLKKYVQHSIILISQKFN